ncbi:MAG TPA: alpha/beta hydrolase [Solirubrobacteraceae bacterium]|jgi:pimeloyl-ACP methyl ester carboxylesterase
MSVIETGSVELSFQRSGSGPPLLLIMGMSGTAMHWGEPFLEPLRAEFEVITYDHRGVGLSGRVEAPFTIADLAGDAAALLDALEVDSAHVLGISMGGMIAQELALARPKSIRTLAIGCTYCGGEGSSLTSQAVMEKLAGGMMSGELELALRSAWEANVSADFARDAGLYDAFRAIGLEHSVALAVIMEQMRAIAGHDTSERLSILQMPTLIIHGTEDQMLPVANAYVLQQRLPHARLEILEGVGHLFFWERPERSAELISEHALAHV